MFDPNLIVVHIAPHPDDELLGAGATLMAARDAGARVVNLALGLGSRADARERRRAELTEACRRAGFALEIARDGLEPTAAVADALLRSGDGLIVGPSPHDGHPAHERAGRAIVDAVESGGALREVIFWGLWGELPLPNRITWFDAARLAELQHALAAHAGELERNGFDRLLEHRAAANAVLAAERVGGFGAAGVPAPYAELLTHVRWDPDRRAWELLGPGGGTEIGWWLHAESARSRLAAASAAARSPRG